MQNKTKISKEDQEKYKEDNIVSQSAEPGTKLEEGDTIILYYAVFTIEYPDFVNESYSVSSVEAFCEQYNVILNIKYEESDTHEEGTILYQSRTGEVTEGATLTITVAKKPEVQVPDEPTVEDSGDAVN